MGIERATPIEGPRDERAPALAILGAFAAGIGLEAALALDGFSALLGAPAAFLLVCFCRRYPLRVVALLLGWLCLGAAAQERVAGPGHPAEAARWARSGRRLIRLSGTVVEPPALERTEAPFWSDKQYRPRTRCRLDEIFVADEAGQWRPLAGQVEFRLTGALPELRLGDEIETLGWLEVADPARNPGGFDTAAWDRRRGIDARLYTEFAQTVHIESRERFSPSSLLAGLRRWLGRRLDRVLSPENAAIGKAMLLGDRSAMSDELRNAYRVTGAMHVIAISGMHIAVLAVALSFLARLVRVSPALRAGSIIAIIWAYAALTGMEEPVTRAAIFLTLWAVGVWLERPNSALNTVALAALVLLAWDPRILFDIGARLSFLAVLGISWAARLAPGLAKHPPPDRFGQSRPLRRAIGSLWRGILLLQLATFGIWLFIGPLIARDFGLLAPITLPLNLVLVPLSTLVLWAGFVLLAVCWLPAVAASGPAALFGGGLWIMNRLVEWAAAVPGGHSVAVAPPGWWLGVWYVLLLASLIGLRGRRRRFRSLIPLAAWGLIGLAALPAPDKGAGLRMTMLDVGHGGAILIEAPNGKTLLYDCGSMSGGRRPATAVWDCLRLWGHRDLDELVISHPDLDHCNGVPPLMERGPVGAISVSRHFLDFSQQAILDACQAAREAETPIHLIAAGDRLPIAPNVRVDILHPESRRGAPNDNANSLVLQIDYAGRRILLTGDLEGAGLMKLLARHQPRRCDILIAPHHGSEGANTPALAHWARPRIVLISTADPLEHNRFRATYRTARRICATSDSGAITIRIRPNGGILVTEQLAADGTPSR